MSYNILTVPKATYWIHVTDGFMVEQSGKPPHLLHRLMMRILLGWKIEVVK